MAAVAGVYREYEDAARRRCEDLLRLRRHELQSPEVAQLTQIYRRRCARSVAGLVGVVAAVVALTLAPLSMIMDHRFWRNQPPPWVAASWFAALALPVMAYLLSYAYTGTGLRRWRAWLTRPSHDIAHDLAKLEAYAPRQVLQRVAARWPVASIALPLMAVALLGPLTLHAPFALLGAGATGFASWMGYSALIVGHAHLVYAALTIRHAHKLHRDPHETRGPWPVLGWVVLASAVPGIVLFALPPIITAVTGALLVFPSFAWARRTALRERAILAW